MASESNWSQTDGIVNEKRKEISATEKVLERISNNPTVQELLTFDRNGIVLRATMDTARAQIYRTSVTTFSSVAKRTVKNMDPRDDLKFIRMRTQTNEIIIAPDDSATLMVIQQVEPYEAPYRPPKEQPDVAALKGQHHYEYKKKLLAKTTDGDEKDHE